MARTVTGVALGPPLLLPGDLTVIPAHADFAAFSPTYLAVFLICRPILRRFGRGAGGNRASRD
jgi:hypothetical protein